MDVEALHLTLQQSFSPDAGLRDPAEATIRNLKHVKGATVMLLRVSAEKQVRMTSHAKRHFLGPVLNRGLVLYLGRNFLVLEYLVSHFLYFYIAFNIGIV